MFAYKSNTKAKHILATATILIILQTLISNLILDDIMNASKFLNFLFSQGLYQKAEALYSMGDFEYALMYYHRGYKLRPELDEFRLGIQKAQEAIDNSIGSRH